jgi:5-methylcytosine-specific restriction endonuclease McrA
MPPKGLREFCSPACWFNWNRYNGDRPTETTCVGCGCEIDLTARGKRGQLRKVTVKFCRRCKQDYSKYGMTVEQIAERDGLACGICGQLVDLGLSRADGLMCPSIDHIIPRARGGTHDPANLQLAHLYCNMVKSDRVAAKSPDLIGGGSHE